MCHRLRCVEKWPLKLRGGTQGGMFDSRKDVNSPAILGRKPSVGPKHTQPHHPAPPANEVADDLTSICLVREDVHRDGHEGAQDKWKQASTSCFTANAAKGKPTMQFADIIAASNRRRSTWHIAPCSRFLSPLTDKAKRRATAVSQLLRLLRSQIQREPTMQVRAGAIKIGDIW